MPAVARKRASRFALKGQLRDSFDNSYEQRIAALLEDSRADLPDAELKKLSLMIGQARKKGRQAYLRHARGMLRAAD